MTMVQNLEWCSVCMLSCFNCVWLFVTPTDCGPPGSSVHGILQVRILEWVAISCSRGSFQAWDQTHVSCLLHWQVEALPLVPPGKPGMMYIWAQILNLPFTSYVTVSFLIFEPHSAYLYWKNNTFFLRFQWTSVWVNSGSWWWTGRPGVLQFMGSQRVGHDWATELNWTELSLRKKICNCHGRLYGNGDYITLSCY